MQSERHEAVDFMPFFLAGEALRSGTLSQQGWAVKGSFLPSTPQAWWHQDGVFYLCRDWRVLTQM
jgi:hypothetical protein